VEQGTVHPAPQTHEIELRVEGTGLPALFEEAGYALAELMLGAALPETPERAEEEQLVLQSADIEALLAHWLNELISRSQVKQRVYTSVVVDTLSERGLRARIRGIQPPAVRTVVRAASFRGARIREHDDGFTASAVLYV